MAVLLRKEWLWLVLCLLLVAMIVLLVGNRNRLASTPDKATEAGEESQEDFRAGQPTLEPQNDFFVEYRLERERVRSQQMDVLREIIHNPSTDPQNRKEAHSLLLEAAESMRQETEIEGLIKAKGFQDAVVFLQPEQVQVIIKGEGLDQKQATQIGDLVRGMYGVPWENIVIDWHR